MGMNIKEHSSSAATPLGSRMVALRIPHEEELHTLRALLPLCRSGLKLGSDCSNGQARAMHMPLAAEENDCTHIDAMSVGPHN